MDVPFAERRTQKHLARAYLAREKKKGRLRGLSRSGNPSRRHLDYATSTVIFLGFTSSALGRVSSSTPSL